MKDVVAKRLAEHSLQLALAHQSPKTGCVQFDDRISILHQWLFALACCKSKKKDLILEASARIDRLLLWQNEQGGFPRYLHEYPHSHCLISCLKIFFCLVQIKHLLKGVLQKQRLDPWIAAAEALEGYLTCHLSSPLHQLWFACVKSYQTKQPLSASFLQEVRSTTFFSPKEWGEHCCFLQSVPTLLPELAAQVRALYHPRFGYVGPMEKVSFIEGRQELNHLDLFFGGLPQESNHPLVLEGALALPCSFSARNPLSNLGMWQMEEKECYAKVYKRGILHVFGEETAWMFSCEGLQCRGEGLEVPVRLNEEKSSVVAEIFWTYHKATQILVEGKPASLFHLGDRVEVICPDFSFEMVWKLCEGEGDFTGHFRRGARLSEESKMRGPDHVAMIRALRYNEGTKLFVSLRFS
ncbi:MAG: hypothetical protein AAGF04_04825 [Chlamydiota bacterium]